MYVCRWLTPEDTCDSHDIFLVLNSSSRSESLISQDGFCMRFHFCMIPRVAALLSFLERVAAMDILLGQLRGGGEEETEDLQLAELQANL